MFCTAACRKIEESCSSFSQYPPPEHQDEDRRPLFVDRKIPHTFHDGEYVGRVISAVPGFPQWFNVIYEGDEAVYTYKLYDDYASGDLRIIV